MHRKRFRSAAACLTVALLPSAAGLSFARPAAASGVTASIGTVQLPDRWEPRVAEVYGAGTTGLVYVAEQDPGDGAPGGHDELFWHPYAGGGDTDLGVSGGPEEYPFSTLTHLVLGDRLVTINPTVSPTGVVSRTLPSGSDTTLSVPTGYTFVTATGDGALLRSGPDNNAALSVLPWGSATPVAIGGVPSDLTIPGPQTGAASDIHGSIIGFFAATNGSLYVDTTLHQAWSLPQGNPTGGESALDADTLAWWDPPPAVGQTHPEVATLARPTSPTASLGSVHLRPAPNGAGPTGHMSLQPFGADVLIWGTTAIPTREVNTPVFDLDQSGFNGEFLAWGHGAHTSPDGQNVYAVSSDAPPASAIISKHLGSTTLATEVSLTPLPARAGGVAVDGAEVVVQDDSDRQNAISRYPLAANGSDVTVGPRTEIANTVDPFQPIAAGFGRTTFLTLQYQQGDAITTYGGTRLVAQTGVPAGVGPPKSTDGRVVLLDSANDGSRSVHDPQSDTFTNEGVLGPSLANGALYQPTNANPQTSITTKNLLTGATGSIASPAGCAEVHDVQAAGRWLLLACAGTTGGVSDRWAVVDRLGQQLTWTDVTGAAGLGVRWLGDGFVVRDNSGELEWTDVSDVAHTWHTLGSWVGSGLNNIALDQTGRTATVAWLAADAVPHVAILPLTDSLDAPLAPTGLVGARSGTAANISWTAPADDRGSPISAYGVVVSPACDSCTGLTVDPTQTHATVEGLSPDVHYMFSVVAENAVGTSPASNILAVRSRLIHADFDGDGRSDHSVWRPSNGTWYVKGKPAAVWGAKGDVPLPADFTGDGRTDFAVWRPSNATWYVNGRSPVAWGTKGDVPLAADFTGDGIADYAVWRPSNGTWYVKGLPAGAWGVSGDVPVAGDFTGDGTADFAVWRPSNGTWYVKGLPATTWGRRSDVPLVTDFNGDGKADFAVWRPSNGTWYVKGRPAVAWGVTGDVPVAEDFNGDDVTDITVWRPKSGAWYTRGQAVVTWGIDGDVPL